MLEEFVKVGSEKFLWAGGIEDTFVPQTRSNHRALDEYELMGHYENWREDLALGSELGLNAVRWGVPWYRVERIPGEFDWNWTDEVIPYIVEELKITPIIDLMHYGCPFWLNKEFANKDYPQRVANYAAKFAERYKKWIKWYTPLNEPIINALMCGKRGIWPPYLRGDRGYIRIMLQLAKGIIKTVKAINEIDAEAKMFHVEATGLTRSASEDLSILALEDQRRGYICYDLITGKIDHRHALFSWLLRNGATVKELTQIASEPITLDVIGMNFYPQWSTKQIYLNKSGRISYRNWEEEGTGLSELITDYYNHYKVPVMITETSAFPPDEVRSRWLQSSIATIKNLRAAGVPVIGYTWFPLFTMIDWRYRLGNDPVENYRLELGLYRLDDEKRNGSRWSATPLVEEFKKLVANSKDAIGAIGEA